MAGLDDLFAQIPVADIASKLGADEGEVNTAIQTLVPALVGSLQHNVESNDIDSSTLESAVSDGGASGLLDGGVNVNDVDEHAGDQLVSHLFGGNNSESVASALAGTGGAGNGGLVKQLLPILAPIVIAYIGKQFLQKNEEPAQAQASSGGGGLADVLGSILGGAVAGGGGAAANNNPLGSILGSVLGGGQGNAIGSILGGLLGGKK